MTTAGAASPEAQPPPPSAAEAALALLLERARADPALSAQTSEYLVKHGRMLELQMENLHEQRCITLNHLKRQELSDRLKLALQVLTIMVGVAIALFLAAAVLDASRSNALVIEPISTPADITALGLTPTAASAQLLDKLRAMQAKTDSARAADTYRSNWGDEIEVEIPQTGVSVGELFRLMRRWLGSDTYISGEIMRTPRGIALTSRVGEQPGRTFVSATGDLDDPMQRAAETVYAATQPYRYAVYLSQNGRTDEAVATFRRISENGSLNERAWAWIGLAGQAGATGDFRRAAAFSRQGLALNPDLAAGWLLLAGAEQTLGRDEQALAAIRRMIESIKRPDDGGMTKAAAAQAMLDGRATIAEFSGDYRQAIEIRTAGSRLARYQGYAPSQSPVEAIDRIFVHEPLDPKSVPLSSDDVEWPIYRARLVAAKAQVSDDWRGVAETLENLEREEAGRSGANWRRSIWPTQVWPWRAYAYARGGRLAEAKTLSARTPLDCYLCLRVRGRVAALAGDKRGRDYWFGQAVAAGPSLPFAYGEWGRALAEAGEHKAAAGRLRHARKKGPHWADSHVLGLKR